MSNQSEDQAADHEGIDSADHTRNRSKLFQIWNKAWVVFGVFCAFGIAAITLLACISFIVKNI